LDVPTTNKITHCLNIFRLAAKRRHHFCSKALSHVRVFAFGPRKVGNASKVAPKGLFGFALRPSSELKGAAAAKARLGNHWVLGGPPIAGQP